MIVSGRKNGSPKLRNVEIFNPETYDIEVWVDSLIIGVQSTGVGFYTNDESSAILIVSGNDGETSINKTQYLVIDSANSDGTTPIPSGVPTSGSGDKYNFMIRHIKLILFVFMMISFCL